MQIAAGDRDARADIVGDGADLDAIATAVNTLADQVTSGHPGPDRLAAVLRVTMQLATGDLTARAQVLGDGDDLDAIAATVNMLADELTHSREALEKRLDGLESLNAAKSEFVSIVSHEFRTPLTGIQGFSELMSEEGLTPEEMREFAKDINRDARRLSRLIGDMLDLDRMETGRVTMHLEPVDLNAVLEEVVEGTAGNAVSRPVTVDFDPDLPAVAGDRDKLVQVMTNLVANAVKYSPDGGAIEISSRAEGPLAHVQISDHGLGIPTEALDTIFQRFTRVDSAETRGIKGTGLGLPIARHIVELHGGRVWAESVLGEGSTFHVTLQLSADR
jgi:signal transduction histidine kinase